jgi:hypothetical protein
MNAKILDRIRKEIEDDPEQYLINCRSNYSEYIAAAKVLFPNYYKTMQQFTQLYTLTEKSLEFKRSGNLNSELQILEHVITKGIDTPYPYERISIIYAKFKDYRSSKKICETWFSTIFWKIPNMSSGSLRIFNRLKKLKSKLHE